MLTSNVSLDSTPNRPPSGFLPTLLPPLIPPTNLPRDDLDGFIRLPKLLENPLALLHADPMVQHEPTGERADDPARKIIRLQRTRTFLGVVCFGHAHRIPAGTGRTKKPDLAGGGNISC